LENLSCSELEQWINGHVVERIQALQQIAYGNENTMDTQKALTQLANLEKIILFGTSSLDRTEHRERLLRHYSSSIVFGKILNLFISR
jgi:hypothetical protein